MQRFEITIDGVPQGDFASQEQADAAATAARHDKANTGKQVIARPKAGDASQDARPVNPEPAVRTTNSPDFGAQVQKGAERR